MKPFANELSKVLEDIRNDKIIFENFEIDSTYAKYQRIAGNAKVFDYWYDQFNALKDKVDQADNSFENALLENVKTTVQKIFDSCYNCYKDLNDTISKFANYKISMVRANIDFASSKVVLMILYKTTNNEFPENFSDFVEFQRDIYNVQEKANERSSYYFSLNSIYYDESISIDCITRDFPICIRN